MRWLERYRGLVRAPVRERTQVTSLDRHAHGWRVATPDGDLLARAVIVATGPFQRSRIPRLSDDLPGNVLHLHSVDYHRPDLLPDGSVLVVGSGASGAQIAEELAGASRAVYLCVSRHRRVPRHCLGRDITSWLTTLGLMDRTRSEWAGGRMPPTVLVTGIDGGHDLNLRALGAQGVTLLGTLRSAADEVLYLADDAEPILAAADDMHAELVRLILQHAAASNDDHRVLPRMHARRATSPCPGYGRPVDDSVPWLTTPLCALLGIRVPVVQAPVGSATTPELVAAVSGAGGLGMLAITWLRG